MKITRVLAAECRLPIARPIRLGPVEIKARDFVVVRLETDAGLVGDALAYPRGGALLESVGRLAPLVVGTEVAFRRRTTDDLLQRFVNNRAGFIKAASLIDIALWDLAAKEVRQPLHRMLGAVRAEIPVMVVAGYYLDSRTIADVAEEVRALVGEGYSRIKIMISGTDPEFDERLVASVKPIAGDRLCVDAHWAFRSIADAYRTCKRLEAYDLTFIEDPFGPDRCDLSAELQSRLSTPIAFGEDLPDAQSLHRAIGTALHLRLDATTCGGICLAISSAEEAGIRGRSVLPHVFLPVHAQIAGAIRAIDAVEYIPIVSRACPMFDLLDRQPAIAGGILTIDTEPGAGFSLDWAAVERTAINTFKTD